MFDAEYGCTPVDDAFDDGLEAEFVEEHELEEEDDEDDDEEDDGDGVVDDDVELDRIFWRLVWPVKPNKPLLVNLLGVEKFNWLANDAEPIKLL